MGEIPKVLHAIWVGDESKCPHKWLATWRDKHPSWEFKLWGNAELAATDWTLRRQIEWLAARKMWHGVSDLMRYEILFHHGGVYVDADSECVEPIDELLAQCPASLLSPTVAFAAYENEIVAPGLIANGTIGAMAGHPVFAELMREIGQRRNPLRSGPKRMFGLWRRREQIWRATGPQAFTNAVRKVRQIYVLPSVSFYPVHHSGVVSPTRGKSYARQYWATTKNLYGSDGVELRNGIAGE